MTMPQQVVEIEAKHVNAPKLYQEVYEACMAYVASITGVAPSPEVLSIVAAAASEAVAFRAHTDSSSTCIAQAIGTVASQVSTVREKNHAQRAASAAVQKVAKKVVAEAVRIAFEIDNINIQTGGDSFFATSDETLVIQELERSILSHQGQLPEGAEYVVMPSGELMLKMPLEGEAGRFVLLPAENLYFVHVQETADGHYNIIMMTAPELGEDDAPLQMQRTAISWVPEGLAATVGGEISVDALADRMRDDAELSRQIFEAHLERMRFETMQRAMEAERRAREAQVEQRLAVTSTDLLSAIHAPPADFPPHLVANEHSAPPRFASAM